MNVSLFPYHSYPPLRAHMDVEYVEMYSGKKIQMQIWRISLEN